MSTDAFWNRIAIKYANKPVPDEAIYQQKLQKTQALLTSDSKVLEFGCGTGNTAIEHACRVAQIDALDFSAKMIELCNERKAQANADNVRFHQTTLDDFAPPNNHYDVVLGLSILHLLKEKDKAIQQAFATLKPGGYFVSSTSCVADTMKVMRYIAPIGKALGLLPEINVFGKQELEQSLVNAGFQLIEVWQPSDAVFIIAKK